MVWYDQYGCELYAKLYIKQTLTPIIYPRIVFWVVLVAYCFNENRF